MNWPAYFDKERQVRALVRRAGVARPRIETLTAQLMRPRRSGEPGLLAAAAITPASARAMLAALTVLESKLEGHNLVSRRAQPIAPADLARIKDALK